jgi:hypothetical protein
VLGWSIKPVITLPDSIKTSIETRIASQNQAVSDNASLVYLRQQFGEQFDEVIRYMVARNPGAFVDASPLLKKQTSESLASTRPEVTDDMSLQQPPSPPERSDHTLPHEQKGTEDMSGRQQPPQERDNQVPSHSQKNSPSQSSQDTEYEERLKRLRGQRPHG